MSKKSCVGLFLILVIVVLTAGPALAADGELPWGNFGWRMLNIVIFVALLYKLLGKKACAFFKGRQESIGKDLDDLEARRKEAKKKLLELESSIGNLDQERQAILDESKAQAEASKEAIIAEAHRQAEQILVTARRTAENEGRSMLAEVRSALADEIVDAAEKVLESKLDNTKHGKLITNSLTKVVLN